MRAVVIERSSFITSSIDTTLQHPLTFIFTGSCAVKIPNIKATCSTRTVAYKIHDLHSVITGSNGRLSSSIFFFLIDRFRQAFYVRERATIKIGGEQIAKRTVIIYFQALCEVETVSFAVENTVANYITIFVNVFIRDRLTRSPGFTAFGAVHFLVNSFRFRAFDKNKAVAFSFNRRIVKFVFTAADWRSFTISLIHTSTCVEYLHFRFRSRF